MVKANNLKMFQKTYHWNTVIFKAILPPFLIALCPCNLILILILFLKQP